MPFRLNVARFVRGNSIATLLRILTQDSFIGLVHFEHSGTTEWVNSAQLAHFGWTPQA
jgi:hypothetical protein